MGSSRHGANVRPWRRRWAPLYLAAPVLLALVLGGCGDAADLAPTVGAPADGPDAGRVAASTAVAPGDGMAVVHVAAGPFTMGTVAEDPIALDDEIPTRQVFLDAFWIDRTEITNAMFARFVAETGHETTAEQVGWAWVFDGAGTWGEAEGAYWRRPAGPGSSVAGRDDHPVVHVSWHDADAYCRWAGRQLPSEAQWEKAARGTDGRRFPWGDEAPAGHLLNYADGNVSVEWADWRVDDGHERTAPVGSFPAGASPYGALDMAGNVREWVADWYDADYYRVSPRRNPTGPDGGETRGQRGGSWANMARSVRSALRGDDLPDSRDDDLGFRCAMP